MCKVIVAVVAALSFFAGGLCFGQETLYSGPIREPSGPPKGAVVRVKEYTMIDGTVIGIREWTETTEAYEARRASAVPRPGRAGGVPAGSDPSAGDTPAAPVVAHPRAVAMPRSAETLLDLPVTWTDATGTSRGSLGAYLALGSRVDDVAGNLSAAERDTLQRHAARSVPVERPFVVTPGYPTTRATTARSVGPASTSWSGSYPAGSMSTFVPGAGSRGGISAGFQFRGPFGGGFGAEACIGGSGG